MTKEEFTTIQRQGEWSDFARLTKNLRAVKIDFNYAKTRKLLDPKWNEYSSPVGNMDIEIEDANLYTEANLVTSRIKDSDLHKPVLDLDYGAEHTYSTIGGHRLILGMHSPLWVRLDPALVAVLEECGIPNNIKPQIHRTAKGNGALDLHTNCDISLTPSSTTWHCHLILDVAVSWSDYTRLLNVMSYSSIIEPGYAKASISKGYSAIRPPWIHK